MTAPLPEYEGPDYGPCPWPVDPSCLSAEWDALSEDDRTRGLALASGVLHDLTGRRVGGCPVTVRPCNPGSCVPYNPMYPQGTLFRPGINAAGAWINNAGCGCAEDACGHVACQVSLPSPVGAIYEVKVDGAVVDAADYRVDNGHLLVWQGTGDCPWPSSQDLAAPDTAEGTFSVTFLNSYPVDRLGAQAVTYLALEFAKLCAGSNDCKLPVGVVQVVRAGVTYQLQPGLFPDGYTGIEAVDAYIAMWNPRGLKQDSAIWAPGSDGPRLTTWTGGP